MKEDKINLADAMLDDNDIATVHGGGPDDNHFEDKSDVKYKYKIGRKVEYTLGIRTYESVITMTGTLNEAGGYIPTYGLADGTWIAESLIRKV